MRDLVMTAGKAHEFHAAIIGIEPTFPLYDDANITKTEAYLLRRYVRPCDVNPKMSTDEMMGYRNIRKLNETPCCDRPEMAEREVAE